MNHNSNEVKQLLARVCNFLARTVPPNLLVPEFLKIVIPMLVNGTKEKNGYVKANSELALVAVLGLRSGEERLQECLALLDLGAKESLSDVVSKVKKITRLSIFSFESKMAVVSRTTTGGRAGEVSRLVFSHVFFFLRYLKKLQFCQKEKKKIWTILFSLDQLFF